MTIINNFETEMNIKGNKNTKKNPSSYEDVKKLTLAYNEANVFSGIQQREYESFPKFKKELLSTLDGNFQNWIDAKESEFSHLYKIILKR